MIWDLQSCRTFWTGRGMLAVAPQAFMVDIMMAPPMVYAQPFETVNGVAVVDIRGVLTHHPDNPACDSYDGIRERMSAAFHSECPAVLMRVDSLGGDVAGCFDLAAWIGHEAKEHGKRLFAYTEGTAASAAYALACVAEVIGVGATGFVGSIGIINALMDQTAADAAMGLRFGFATSGARKGDGNPHVPISDEAMANLQRQVDDLAQVFFAHVAAHRGIAAADVQKLQAGLFFGAGAIATRLADRVCSWGDMLSLAAEITTKPEAAMPKYLEEARKMASKMVADGDEKDREMAKKMMALFGEDGDDSEKKKDDAKAESEEPKEEAKAEAEEPKDEAKAKAEGPDSEKMKAAATANPGLVFELQRELHAMKAAAAAEKIEAERAKLLASRPDFPATTQAWLAVAPIETVRNAVAAFPVIPANPAAASQAMGTRGATQNGVNDPVPGLSAEDAAFIATHMGRAVSPAGVVHEGREMTFYDMTPEQARARLAELEKGAR